MEKDSGAMIQLDIKIDKLCNGVESLKEKQETMAEDIVKIKEAIPYFIGKHDFNAFRSIDCQSTSSIKTINDCNIQ